MLNYITKVIPNLIKVTQNKTTPIGVVFMFKTKLDNRFLTGSIIVSPTVELVLPS